MNRARIPEAFRYSVNVQEPTPALSAPRETVADKLAFYVVRLLLDRCQSATAPAGRPVRSESFPDRVKERRTRRGTRGSCQESPAGGS